MISGSTQAITSLRKIESMTVVFLFLIAGGLFLKKESGKNCLQVSAIIFKVKYGVHRTVPTLYTQEPAISVEQPGIVTEGSSGHRSYIGVSFL